MTPIENHDYVQDFLGTKEYFRYANPRLRYQIDPKFPNSLKRDENYFEWIDILESVASARKTYTFVEVGAGYGRWSARAYRAAKHFGFSDENITLITIEPEPLHSSYLKEHFAMNDIPLISSQHYQVAVSDHEEAANLFHVRPNRDPNAESYEWYGQAIAYSEWENAKYTPIQVHRLSKILNRFSNRTIDLVNFDIQGEEPRVLRDIQGLLSNIRNIRIGTNSREDEDFIRQFFVINGWKKTRDYKGQGLRRTYVGKVSFLDGVLTYTNTGKQQVP